MTFISAMRTMRMTDEDAVDQGSSEIPRSREGRCRVRIEIASLQLLALVASRDDGAICLIGIIRPHLDGRLRYNGSITYTSVRRSTLNFRRRQAEYGEELAGSYADVILTSLRYDASERVRATRLHSINGRLWSYSRPKSAVRGTININLLSPAVK